MKRTARRPQRATAARVLLGVSAAVAGSSARPARAMSDFSAEVMPDRETGWGIVVLRHQDPGGTRSVEVKIAPAAGSNLFSWKIDGNELLLQPATLPALVEQRAGTPLMFPMVNRVRDGKMTFEGRAFEFEPNNGKNFIHGLARRRPFQVGAVSARPARAVAVTYLEWDETQPDFARFPIKHRLTMTYTLRKSALEIAYTVDNRDRTRLPFGFGLHPYFRIPKRREDVTITVPLDKRMEAIEYLPTGKLIPVADTTYDLRRAKSLAQLSLDDVYLGMTPAKVASFALGPAGPRIELGGSAELTHLVVFTPPDRPFFCIENQTSSTDAHNLHAQGKKREAHLLVVPAGKQAAGTVTWTIRRR